MRLIDGDAIAKQLKSDDSLKHAREIIRLFVEESPTIDAVPVCHCRDCKHCKQFVSGWGNWCTAHENKFRVCDENFCSFAERNPAAETKG